MRTFHFFDVRDLLKLFQQKNPSIVLIPGSNPHCLYYERIDLGVFLSIKLFLDQFLEETVEVEK